MKHFALALSASLLLAAPAPTLAKDAPKDSRQFIDKSYVSLPRAAGRYRYGNGSYDPKQWQAGVVGHYDYAGEPPGMVISLYVYPQGRTPEAEAVKLQADDVESAIRQHPSYSSVEAGTRVPFIVELPPPSLAPGDGSERKQKVLFTGTPPARAAPDEDSDSKADGEGEDSGALVKALAESAPPSQAHGSRQSFAMVNKGTPMRSAGLVYFRHLFNIKLRISVPVDAMTQAEFDAVVDDAARSLLPAVDVQNFGLCGDMVIALDDAKRKDDGESTALDLIQEMGRVRRENCAGTEGKPLAAPVDRVRETIVYPPDTWNTD